MEKTLKALAWIEIILGSLSVLGWIDDTANGAALVEGILFVACGIVALSYISKMRAEAHDRFKNR